MILTATHKDKEFLVSTYGTTKPEWMANSFLLEKDIRERWWHIREGDVVLDIGAGYGSYTLSAIASGAYLVVAFEPNKNDFFELATNLLVNNFTPQCILVNAMCGDRMGVCKNYYEESHSLLPEGEPSERLIYPLDTIVHDLRLPKIDWMKVDVDGMEINVLRGAKDVLTKFRPTLIIENHVALIPDIEEQVKEHLTPLGYKRVATARGNEGTNENWDCWIYPSTPTKEKE